MEIHFYTHEPKNLTNIVHGWDNLNTCIESRVPVIHTTQMGLMSTTLLLMGYRIFIHEKNKEIYEIQLGSNNTCTDKEIRIGHNLFKMWENEAFRPTPIQILINSAT